MNRLLRKKKNKKTNGTFPPYLIFLAESYQIRVSDWQGEREMDQPWRAFRTKRKDVIAYGSSEARRHLKMCIQKEQGGFRRLEEAQDTPTAQVGKDSSKLFEVIWGREALSGAWNSEQKAAWVRTVGRQVT